MTAIAKEPLLGVLVVLAVAVLLAGGALIVLLLVVPEDDVKQQYVLYAPAVQHFTVPNPDPLFMESAVYLRNFTTVSHEQVRHRLLDRQ